MAIHPEFIPGIKNLVHYIVIGDYDSVKEEDNVSLNPILRGRLDQFKNPREGVVPGTFIDLPDEAFEDEDISMMKEGDSHYGVDGLFPPPNRDEESWWFVDGILLWTLEEGPVGPRLSVNIRVEPEKITVYLNELIF